MCIYKCRLIHLHFSPLFTSLGIFGVRISFGFTFFFSLFSLLDYNLRGVSDNIDGWIFFFLFLFFSLATLSLLPLFPFTFPSCDQFQLFSPFNLFSKKALATAINSISTSFVTYYFLWPELLLYK